MKYQWPEPSRKIRAERKKLGYYMQFRIRSIEVLTHRHKRIKPCNEDWQNDDPNFIQQVLGVIGCTPPQLKLDSLPICSTKETLSESHKILNYPTTIDLRNIMYLAVRSKSCNTSILRVLQQLERIKMIKIGNGFKFDYTLLTQPTSTLNR